VKRTLELRYYGRNGDRRVSREAFVALLAEARTRKVSGEPVSIVRLGEGVYEISLLLKLLRLIPKNEPLGVKLLRKYSTNGYGKGPAIRVSHGGNHFTLLSGAAIRTSWCADKRRVHELPDKALSALKIKMVGVKK